MPCVACGSLRGWQVCCGISGKFAVESAATLLWNQWQVLRGIGGNFRMESVATFARNTHPPNSRAIRRDEYDRHNRKVARIQYAHDRLLWWSRVSVRSLKVRWQPLHQ